jgi:hypothetical protein
MSLSRSIVPFALVPLAVGLAYACGGSSASPSGSDGGDDASAGDVTTNETGNNDVATGGDADAGAADHVSTDSPSGDGGVEAACTHTGDPADAAADTGVPKGVDAGSPLTFFDIGVADRPVGVSSDGKIAVVQDGASAIGDVYFYDTATGAITRKTATGDPAYCLATAVAPSGNRVSAYHYNSGSTSIVAGIWDTCSGWADQKEIYDAGCPGPPDNESSAFDLNANGSVAVGLMWNGCHTDATMWTEQSGKWTTKTLQHLGMAGGSERASVISDDGAVIGGFAQVAAADRNPAVWSSNGTGVLLDPTQMVVGEVLSVSPDGTMVAGVWNLDGFIWTKAAGVTDIGKLAGAQPTDAVFLNAIADNNQLVVGGCGDPNPGGLGNPVAAIAWTKAKGMRLLQDIVTAQGFAIPGGYALTNVMGASKDGTVLLGYATDMLGSTHTFVLRMPVSAY